MIAKDITITTRRVIEVTKIDDTEFCFYIDTFTETEGDTSTVYTGVTSIENVENTTGLTKISNQINAPEMHDGTAVIAMISASDLVDMLSGNKHITEVIKPVNRYDSSKGGILVLWNACSYTICNLKHEFISIPISLGYIDGSITNENYDLDKLLIKLKNDPHVLNRSKLRITSIPYYNATTYSNRSIEFQYLMDTNEYRKTVNMDCYSIRDHIMSLLIGADDCKIEIEEDDYE